MKEWPQTCGCIVLTEQGHVKDVKWCPEHKAEWDEAVAKHFETTDQMIEDAIFNASIEERS